jgi:hypothetical protein
MSQRPFREHYEHKAAAKGMEEANAALGTESCKKFATHSRYPPRNTRPGRTAYLRRKLGAQSANMGFAHGHELVLSGVCAKCRGNALRQPASAYQ